MVKNTDNFIMLPTVDFCFKKLMKNDKVRKGFRSGDPRKSCVLRCRDWRTVCGSYEIHMLELRKLPPEAQNEKGIIHWMRFLGGKKERSSRICKTGRIYRGSLRGTEEAELDDQKRLEYELRQKAIRDYNSQMNSAMRRGKEIGEEQGLTNGPS